MTDNPSISARTIEALTAIATGLHDIADAVRETGQYDDRIPVFEDEYDDARQAVAHWLDRNYGPSLGHAVHDWLAAADDVLEVARTNMPQSVTETGPGATQADSAGRGASGGLGERLRALVAEPDPEESQYESVDVAALVGLADEAHRLEVHARVIEQSLRTARAEGEAVAERVRQVADMAAILSADMRSTPYERAIAGRFDETIRAALEGPADALLERIGHVLGGVKVADHPLGKVIGVIRERGTEHYKTATEGRELFVPGDFVIRGPLKPTAVTFAPELLASFHEQIDELGKRLAERIRAEIGLAPNEEDAP